MNIRTTASAFAAPTIQELCSKANLSWFHRTDGFWAINGDSGCHSFNGYDDPVAAGRAQDKEVGLDTFIATLKEIVKTKKTEINFTHGGYKVKITNQGVTFGCQTLTNDDLEGIEALLVKMRSIKEVLLASGESFSPHLHVALGGDTVALGFAEDALVAIREKQKQLK